jgi:hypothetical protein
MKQALVKDQLTPAAPGAPPTAICADCGGLVKLRTRKGTYFWRHAELPRAGCPPSNPEQVATGEGSAMPGDRGRWVRRVGDLAVELHLDAPEGPYFKLQSLRTGQTGDPPELTVNPEEVHELAAALLEAAQELATAEAARQG